VQPSHCRKSDLGIQLIVACGVDQEVGKPTRKSPPILFGSCQSLLEGHSTAPLDEGWYSANRHHSFIMVFAAVVVDISNTSGHSEWASTMTRNGVLMKEPAKLM